jgi:phosphoglycolate phosphatase
VHAARAAKMPVACVSYGYNHGAPIADAQPDLLVDHFLDLLAT